MGAQIDFKDRKDGSCYVSYIVEEHGEYSVGIRFNEEHIPGSPYKVCIIPRSESANKVKISNLDEDQLVLNARKHSCSTRTVLWEVLIARWCHHQGKLTTVSSLRLVLTS